MDSRLLDPEMIKREYFSGENQPSLNITAIYNLFKRKDFPGFKIGKKWYIPRHLFLEWLDNQAIKKAEL